MDDEKEKSTALAEVDPAGIEQLKQESLDLINQSIFEKDQEKQKDLTYLFQINQTKKTMVRVNKLNDLLDVITDQAINRFTNKPDNISNQELIQALKVVQDMAERGQKQIVGATDQPLIQINQQNNEISVGDTSQQLNRESRDKVKNAVMNILNGLGVDSAVMPTKTDDVIDVTEEKKGE